MKHYNLKIIEDSRRIFKTKVADMLSSEVEPNVKPVIKIEPQLEYNNNSSSVATGTITIAMPSGGECYLTNVNASFVKNVTCDIATGKISLQCTVNGVACVIGAFAVLTLTAERGDLNIQFEKPFRVDKGTNFLMTGTFGAGAMSRSLCLVGYIIPD